MLTVGVLPNGSIAIYAPIRRTRDLTRPNKFLDLFKIVGCCSASSLGAIDAIPGPIPMVVRDAIELLRAWLA